MTDRDLLQDLTESYLSGVVLEAFEEADPPLDPAEHPFDAFTPFREYGIDSFLVLKILRRLENDFGSLPKTLLFENFNINDLANYLAENHAHTLGTMFTEQLQAGS
jgi:polyketide synthase PksN